jgi:predicted kinase
VCPDDFRLALHGKAFIGEAEPFVWASVWVALRALLRRHDTVLFDATNTTRARRDELRRNAGGADVFFREITTSARECEKRARAGGREDLLPIIDKMFEGREPLQADELKYSEDE